MSENQHLDANGSIFDRMIASSLLEEVKEMRKDIAIQTKAFSDFKVDIAPLTSIDVKNLQQLSYIKPDDITETISTVKWHKRLNIVVLPIVLALAIKVMFFSFDKYVEDKHNQQESMKSEQVVNR